MFPWKTSGNGHSDPCPPRRSLQQADAKSPPFGKKLYDPCVIMRTLLTPILLRLHFIITVWKKKRKAVARKLPFKKTLWICQPRRENSQGRKPDTWRSGEGSTEFTRNVQHRVSPELLLELFLFNTFLWTWTWTNAMESNTIEFPLTPACHLSTCV